MSCPTPLLPELPSLDEGRPLAAGTVVGGHYRAVSVVHHGGTSVVYEAEDLRHASRVALKELHLPPTAGAAERREAEAWFARESYVLSTLQHPLVPRFYGVFHEGGRSYIVEELVAGVNLDDLVRRHGPLPAREAIAIALKLCDLLILMHEHPQGALVYRDLKPANVIRRAADGEPVLVDFGISRPLQPGVVGTAIGTPGYAPPEQYQGLADQRSDVYALGATLHRLLTGYDPEQGAPFTFPPIRDLDPGLSPDLARVTATALALDPAARYPGVRELREALAAAELGPVCGPAGLSLTPRQRQQAAAIVDLALARVVRPILAGIDELRPIPAPIWQYLTVRLALSGRARQATAGAAAGIGGVAAAPVRAADAEAAYALCAGILALIAYPMLGLIILLAQQPGILFFLHALLPAMVYLSLAWFLQLPALWFLLIVAELPLAMGLVAVLRWTDPCQIRP